MKRLLFGSLLLCSPSAFSALSSTVTVASDYLFNGISQTQEDPALQASLDWAADNGFYAGVWGSNVDYGEGTEIEADAYIGYYTSLTDTINIDVGIAQYTYHGESYSSDYNYAEAYAKFNYGNTNLNFWHTRDYFGTGAAHSIVMITHNIPISDVFSVDVGVDYSKSHDTDKWAWEAGDDYMHWRIGANYTFNEWNLSASYEDTDLDTYGDSTLLFAVSRTFNF